MSSQRTVHAPEAPALLAITIPRVWVSLVSRVDQTSATVKFKARMSPAQLRELVAKMAWPAPSPKESLKKLDAKFRGGHFILSASPSDEEKQRLAVKSPDGLVDTAARVDIEYKLMSGFELHRTEIEGKRGKGFRWELRFGATSEARDFASNLENYMACTDNARGSLQVRYLDAPPEQSIIPEVQAIEDQRQAALELEPEE